MNEQITAPQVRLILSNGENVGIILTKEALKKAKAESLDLIEVASGQDIPVCKILNGGKYKYELQKRKNEAKKKQKVVEIKEIRFSPNIGDNDYNVKLKAAKKFIAEGNKVKFNLRFKGRELAYTDLGKEVFNKAISDLEGLAKVEQEPKLEGRQMQMLMVPIK